MTLKTHKFHTSRDVIFHEHVFPFSASTHKPLPPFHLDPTLDSFESLQGIQSKESESPHQHHDFENDISNVNHGTQQARKSTRPHKIPGYLNDYVCNAHIESSCFTSLTNLCLQPPTMIAHCLSSNSQQLLEQL